MTTVVKISACLCGLSAPPLDGIFKEYSDPLLSKVFLPFERALMRCFQFQHYVRLSWQDAHFAPIGREFSQALFASEGNVIEQPYEVKELDGSVRHVLLLVNPSIFEVFSPTDAVLPLASDLVTPEEFRIRRLPLKEIIPRPLWPKAKEKEQHK